MTSCMKHVDLFKETRLSKRIPIKPSNNNTDASIRANWDMNAWNWTYNGETYSQVNNTSPSYKNACTQYDLKESVFDPFNFSPPKDFMIKLETRMKNYNCSAFGSLGLNDISRKSE